MREVSTRVVEEVARREGVDPTELRPPLYEAIDPEALDNLFRAGGPGRARATGEVRFTYRGYRVTVDAAGVVSVAEGKSTAEAPSAGQRTCGSD